MAKKKSSCGEDGEGEDASAAELITPPDGPGLFGDALPAAPAPYVVLARKYRPETFADLIGQGAMVQTLKNAFATDRIAQGYMLTGVRGVGKTTTARILARALNYAKDGLPDRPTVDFDGYGIHCREIIASRHADVVEMDAASNTGVDNIREIIESARYKPILARYKVFIIDEVHMLSKGAFNALLKTLEEPPAHVKFIFATTEIRKVPVTVLSRCQRFDLRRVDVGVLVEHFQRIATAEGATADPDALALIARAAEGSVRDGLSILDQAIAMGEGKVTGEAVRAMLGLADKGRVFDLAELVFGAKPGPAVLALEALHKDGADPEQVIADLADCVHLASRIKVVGAEGAGEGLSAEERRRATALSGQLSVPLLARAWQMLLKGIEEVSRAPDAIAAAEMVLIRIAYTADLPAPDALIRALGSSAAAAPARAPAVPSAPAGRGPLNAAPATAMSAPNEAPAPPAACAQLPDPRTLEEVVELAGRMRDIRLKLQIEDHVRLVRFEPGRLEVNMEEGAPRELSGEIADRLSKWTGRRWIVALSREPGAPPIGIVRRQNEADEIDRLKADPSVKAVLEAFPEATVRAVRPMKK
jgi:DNA polymerase-3 subunit gamma/tau